MVVFRIARREFVEDLSGRGAQLFGGRWNAKGMPALYASSTLSLAALEVLVHTERSLPPVGMAYAELYIPELLLPERLLTLGEGETPAEYGTNWLRRRESLMLRVPSAILPPEYAAAHSLDFNIILNPLHADFSKVFVASVHDFSFDTRFF